MRLSRTLFRSVVLTAGVGLLSACNTVNNPQLTSLQSVADAGKARAVSGDTSDVTDTAAAGTGTASTDIASKSDVPAATATPVLALVDPAEAKAAAVALTTNSSANETTALVAGEAVVSADPVLPDAVPLPMFRSTATQALIATAMPQSVSDEANFVQGRNAGGKVETAAAVAAATKPQLHNLIGQYAAAYAVPERLVHRVVQRESRYNPAARNGPYLGLMQISHATARGMGYEGSPQGLLNANTNLRYAVKYLAGAYKVAGGNESQAVQFYARGYYYDAKRKGLLEETGLRKGPNSIRTAFIEPAAAGVADLQTAQATDPMTTQSVKRSGTKPQRGLFNRVAVSQR